MGKLKRVHQAALPLQQIKQQVCTFVGEKSLSCVYIRVYARACARASACTCAPAHDEIKSSKQ